MEMSFLSCEKTDNEIKHLSVLRKRQIEWIKINFLYFFQASPLNPGLFWYKIKRREKKKMDLLRKVNVNKRFQINIRKFN